MELTRDDIGGEEDPHGGDDGGEAEQEAEEEPDPGAALAQTPRGVGVAADVPVGDGVYPAQAAGAGSRVPFWAEAV